MYKGTKRMSADTPAKAMGWGSLHCAHINTQDNHCSLQMPIVRFKVQIVEMDKREQLTNLMLQNFEGIYGQN